jgi:hypothetical protein
MTKSTAQMRKVALKLLQFFHQGPPFVQRFSHMSLILLTQ